MYSKLCKITWFVSYGDMLLLSAVTNEPETVLLLQPNLPPRTRFSTANDSEKPALGLFSMLTNLAFFCVSVS